MQTKMIPLQIEKLYSNFTPEASTDQRIQADVLFRFNQFISGITLVDKYF